MHIYTWVIIISLLLALGMILKLTWLTGNEAEPESAAEEAPSGYAAQWTHDMRERAEALRAALGGKKQIDVTSQFRAWVTSAFSTNPEIIEWLEMLSDEQIAALTEHLADFCRDMGFELNWLLDNQIAQNTELMHGLTQIVLLYSSASYTAVRLQEDVEIFRVYHQYLQDPNSRANRELGEHLFGKLVEQGKGNVSISKHLASSNRQRQQQIIETLQQTAAEDPKTFQTTLKTVLIERTLPPAHGTAAPNGATTNGATANGETTATTGSAQVQAAG